MKPPLFVRPLSPQERQALKAGCRDRDAFTLRRSQIILASTQQQRASQIARQLHCSRQTVRNAIHAFNSKGLGASQICKNIERGELFASFTRE